MQSFIKYVLSDRFCRYVTRRSVPEHIINARNSIMEAGFDNSRDKKDSWIHTRTGFASAAKKSSLVGCCPKGWFMIRSTGRLTNMAQSLGQLLRMTARGLCFEANQHEGI